MKRNHHQNRSQSKRLKDIVGIFVAERGVVCYLVLSGRVQLFNGSGSLRRSLHVGCSPWNCAYPIHGHQLPRFSSSVFGCFVLLKEREREELLLLQRRILEEQFNTAAGSGRVVGESEKLKEFRHRRL